MEELKDMTTVENAGATSGTAETKFEELWNAIGYSLHSLTRSDDHHNEEYEEIDAVDREHGKLSNDDEPGWVTCTLS
jgi:hypothetical protein